MQLGEIKEEFIEKVHLNWPLKIEKNVTPKFISSTHISPESRFKCPTAWSVSPHRCQIGLSYLTCPLISLLIVSSPLTGLSPILTDLSYSK